MRLTPSALETPEIHFCLIGATGVGKTSLAFQFVQNIFFGDNACLCSTEDNYRKIYIFNGKRYMLNIYDTTGGLDEFRHYIEPSQAIILIFAINDRRSFVEISKLVNQILSIKKHQEDTYSMLLVGNKSDQEDEREISLEEANALAGDIGGDYVECCAKTPVDHVFQHCIRQLSSFQENQVNMKNKSSCKVM